MGEPVDQFLPMSLESAVLQVENLSYSKIFGHRVRRKWKSLIAQGDIRESMYADERSCLRCGETFEDALKMYIHIKQHLP